jgi:hypothetical protein
MMRLMVRLMSRRENGPSRLRVLITIPIVVDSLVSRGPK